MKTTLHFLKRIFLATALLGILFACDDSTETPEALGSEESKDQLDESMTEVANELDGLATLRSIDVMETMMDMEMEAPPFEDLIQPMNEVAGTSIDDMEEAMEKGIVRLSMSDLFQWGTYTYNFSTDTFDFTEGTTGTFIINSPSTEAMTSNDIQMMLTVEFSEVNIEENLTYTEENEEYIPGFGYYYYDEEKSVRLTILEMFTDVDFSIKQNGTMLIGYDMSMSMDDEDMPKMMTTSFSVEEYKITTSFDATDRSDKITHSTAFSKSDNELAGYEISFDGNLSDERIEEISDEIEMIEESDELPSDEFLSSLDYNLMAELRFGDFVVSGLVDGGKIYDAYDGFDDPEEFDDTNMDDVQYVVDEMNDAMALVLKTKDGKLIGKAEAYLVEDTWEEWTWDETTGRESYIEVTGYEPMIRFKFADGTYISPEDEDPEGELREIFADFIDALEALADEMEAVEDKLDLTKEDEPVGN